MKRNGKFSFIVFGNCFQFPGICWMVVDGEERWRIEGKSMVGGWWHIESRGRHRLALSFVNTFEQILIILVTLRNSWNTLEINGRLYSVTCNNPSALNQFQTARDMEIIFVYPFIFSILNSPVHKPFMG